MEKIDSGSEGEEEKTSNEDGTAPKKTSLPLYISSCSNIRCHQDCRQGSRGALLDLYLQRFHAELHCEESLGAADAVDTLARMERWRSTLR